jgi:hypothetical protein
MIPTRNSGINVRGTLMFPGGMFNASFGVKPNLDERHFVIAEDDQIAISRQDVKPRDLGSWELGY